MVVTQLVDSLMFDIKGLTSTYLLGKEELALIETGTANSAPQIWNRLQKIPYFNPDKVKYIITTHIHLDHSGGASYLLDRCPNAVIAHHHSTSKHLIDPTRLWQSTLQTNEFMAKSYGEPGKIPNERVLNIKSQDLLSLESNELEIVDSPGHHAHHYSIFDRSNENLFVGDSVGWYWPATKAIIPTTPPPRFSFTDYITTLEKYKEINPKTISFTHFGSINEDIESLIDKSIRIVTIWVDAIKEYRSDDPTITADVIIEKLISENHPEFKEMDKNLKEVVFGVPILGILLYLDQLEKNI